MFRVARPAGPRWRKLFVALAYAAIALALLAPMASDVMTSAPDLPDHMALIVQAKLAIDEGQFPLRVGPYSYDGWRYPIFQFYSQIPYTAAGLIYKYLTPTDPYAAYKLAYWVLLALAGYFVYRLALWLTGSAVSSFLAGVLYMAAPYFLVNLHARGAFTEAWAQGLVPLVLYTSFRCYASRGPGWFLAASLSWFALATTHIITFVYAGIFGGILFLIVGVTSRRNLLRLIKLGLAVVFAGLLAAYFLGPGVTADYLRVRDLLWPPFSYNWISPLPALLSPTSLPPEPQPGQLTTPNLNPAVGWPMLVGFGIVLYALVVDGTLTRRRWTARVAAALLVLFALALFMTWSPVDFWSQLPVQLRIIQFPYRLLTQVMWTGALLGAFALAWLFKGRLDGRHLIAGLLLIGMASSSYLPSPRDADFKTADIVAAPNLVTGVSDYLTKPDNYLGTVQRTNLENIPLIDWDSWLRLSEEYVLPTCLPASPSGALIYFKGDVPERFFEQTFTLSFLYNKQVVATKQLGVGPFEWTISLNGPLPASPYKKADKCSLSFAADQTFVPADTLAGSTDQRHLAVRAQTLVIRNADPNLTVLPVTMSQPMCRQEGTETACSLVVPPEARWVQLPVLFYPDLLTLSLDGRKADYVPLYQQGVVLAGLRLEPGTHQVRVQFKGLDWANWTSLLAWLGAAVLLAASIFGRLKRRKPLAVVKR
ncbi:MAG: hypothetical protein M1482_12550 [Chloroflexi bacterium]|nr:hypothetical protein [Chloroflexota bacterium]